MADQSPPADLLNPRRGIQPSRVCICLKLIAGVLSLALTQSLAWAQEASVSDIAAPTPETRDLQAEVQELRQHYDEMAKQLAELRKDAQEKKEKQAGKFTFNIGGQLVMDMLWFAQSPAAQATVGDANDVFDFRRARLYANGEFADQWSYVMGFDFAQGSGDNGRPTFLDNYIAVDELPYLGTLRIGHFFEPFTLERSGSNRNTMFMERSLTDMYAPSRNIGVMFYDQNEAQSLWWAVGSFRGMTDNFGDDAGDQEGQTVDMRLVNRPWYDEPSGGRYYLHLGAAYSFRGAADGTLQYRSRPEAFGNEDQSISATPYYVDTGVLPIDYSQLWGAELLWTHGAFSLQSEAVAAPIQLTSGESVVLTGAYVSVAYFLTGEHIPYNRELAITDRVRPFENVFRVRTEENQIVTGRGAWQIAARLSHLDATEGTVAGGDLTDFTVGLNWFLTPWHRMKFNYILANLDRRGISSETSIFGLRFDMDF